MRNVRPLLLGICVVPVPFAVAAMVSWKLTGDWGFGVFVLFAIYVVAAVSFVVGVHIDEWLQERHYYRDQEKKIKERWG